MQHRRKYQAKILMKVLVLKLKSVNSKMSGSQSFRVSLVIYDSSSDVMYCYCMFAERQAQVLLAKPKLLLETKLNVKVLFRPKKICVSDRPTLRKKQIGKIRKFVSVSVFVSEFNNRCLTVAILTEFSSFPCTFDRCLEPKTLYCMSNN